VFIDALALPFWDVDPLNQTWKWETIATIAVKKVEKIFLLWVFSKKEEAKHGFLERRGFPIQVFELLLQDESYLLL
jgi:hypothetical protein